MFAHHMLCLSMGRTRRTHPVRGDTAPDQCSLESVMLGGCMDNDV